MSARGKNQEAPLTLFSFQDIITSITGIMILVVLMLILNIIESKTSSIKNPVIVENIREMRRSIEQIEAQIVETKEWLEANSGKIPEIDMDALPILMKRQREKINAEKDALETMITDERKLKEKIEETKRRTADARKKIKEQKKLMEMLNESMEKQMGPLETRLKELRKKYEEEKKKVSISVDRSESKSLVVVQCSGDGIKLKSANDGKIEDFTDDSPTNIKTLERFKEWLLKRNSASSEYIAVAVKASGSGCCKYIVSMLKAAGYEYGLEPIAEESEAVF